MASFEGMPLHLHAGGAVIPTTQRPSRDWVERLPDGVEVRVAKDSQVVRIYGCNPDASLDELPILARDYANQALDLMAIRSIGSYALADQASPFICWSGVSEVTIRIVTEAQAAFSMTVGGPPNPPSSVWHESMRYFRMSQTTTDLFDAFRNLYLALESILSTIAPVLLRADGRPAEGESMWTKRALGEAARILQTRNSSMTFDRYLDRPSAGDAVDEVFSDLYQATRTAIFHAKNGRVFALPQNQRDRQQVADALARYMLLYTDLAECVLRVRFLQSGLAAEGFAAVADGLLSQWTVGASAKEYPRSEDFDQAAAAKLLPFETVRAPGYDRILRAAVLGTRPVTEFPSGYVIRSVGARTDPDEPVTIENLGGTLNVEGAHQVEHLLSFQAINSGAKTQYDS